MLPETRAALARYDEWLARTLKSPDAIRQKARRVERRAKRLAIRVRNMAIGVALVLMAALLWGGLIAPLGFAGMMLTAAAIITTMVVLARYPRARAPRLERLPEAPLAALPGQVEAWLDRQRPMLPAPAANELDRLMVRLEAIQPELARLDPDRPEADDARRLIGDHLPRLVQSYADVPEAHRRTPDATRHLREGLAVVSTEIDRLEKALARDRLMALETEGRFLESRWSRKGGSKE